MAGVQSDPLEEARRLIEEGEAAQAVRVLQQMLRTSPESFLGRLRLSEAYLLRAVAGDSMARTMANREFDRALRLVPEQEHFHLMLAELGGRLGRAAELRQLYQDRFKDLPFASECLNVLSAQTPLRKPFAPLKVLKGYPVFLFLLIALAGLALWKFAGSPRPAILPSTSSAGFRLQDLSGTEVALADFRGRKVVILDFWATWCGPCRASLPELSRLRARWAGRNVEVLNVNIQEDPARVRKFLETQNLNLRVLLDMDGEVSRSYRITGIPTLVIIDRQGKERQRIVGHRSDLSSELEPLVSSLLKEG